MIIEISDTFSGFNEGQWRPYFSAVDNLLTAHASGWHLLTPSRPVAEGMLRECGLSERQQSLLQASVISRLATLVGQARSADFTILVTPPGTYTSVVRANQIPVPITTFLNIENCMPTRLLTEDAAFDGTYLRHIASAAARELGYGVRLNLELMHGGGSGLAKQYENIIMGERPSICVTDSDMRYPGGPLGNTAKGVMSKGAFNRSKTVRAVILPVRELENTIPVTFLLEVYNKDPEVRARISKIIHYLTSCKKNDKDNLLAYLDFKEGDTVAQVMRIPDHYQNSILDACKALALVNQKATIFEDKSSNAKIHQGVSANVLGATKDFLQLNPRFDKVLVDKLKKTPFWEAFEKILRLILSFGAAGVPLVGR